MEAMLCLPPLDIYVEEAATAAALRLSSVGMLYSGGKPGKHCHLLEEAVKKTPSLGGRTDNVLPSYTFSRPYKVSIITGAESDEEETLRIYTDGSKSEKGSGAGVYSQQMDLSLTIPLGSYKERSLASPGVQRKY